MKVLHFASLGETSFCFFRAEPSWLAVLLVRLAHLVHFHQEGLDHKLLYATRLPEDAFGMNVEVEMAGFDGPKGASLFGSFAFRRLAMRQPGISRPLRESPFIAAVRIDQQEFDGSPSVGSRPPPPARATTSRSALSPW